MFFYVFAYAFFMFYSIVGCEISTTVMLWTPGPQDGHVLGSAAGRRLCRGPRDLTTEHFCCFSFAEPDDCPWDLMTAVFWVPGPDDGCAVDPRT